ncbi:MAG: extracellular solute-binding protein [Clostridiaceae bacterium]|nr:extracellular solute-binding protein [Clostridiaceae bacterium]
MKKALALLLALAMVFSLAACGGGNDGGAADAGGNQPADTGSDAPADTGSDSGFKDARSLQAEFPDQVAWNDMSEEELLELAKAEGGDITIYGISSRIEKICDLFNEKYADDGLKAVAFDLDQTEAIDKVRTEAETKNVNADVLQCKDVAGDIFIEFVPLEYVELYFPTDICEHIVDENLMTYGMPFYSTLSYWYYNTDLFPDAEPITNWWQFVEKDENGNQKYSIVAKEIGTEQAYLSLFASFIVNADAMEKAYEDLYGEPLEYTYDASEFTDIVVPENNAGYEFMYRFSQQEMTFISDGDEIVSAVHNGIEGRPTFGLASAGKISGRDDDGLSIAWLTDLQPYNGIQNCNYLYPIAGCDSPAGARLFIRFMMGDGFEAMCKEGNWSVVDNFENPKNPFPISEANAIAPDLEAIYNVFLDTQDAWIFWLNQNTNM